MVTQDAEFFGRVSDLNVNLWGFHFQTHTHTKKKEEEMSNPPSLDFCYVPSLPVIRKKKPSPHNWGGVSTIYSIHFYDDTIFFFFKGVHTIK